MNSNSNSNISNGADEPDRILLELDRTARDAEPGSGDVLRVSMRSYKGHPFVDIRLWWLPQGESERKPGKGTTIRRGELRQVIEALEAAETDLGGQPRAPRTMADRRPSSPPTAPRQAARPAQGQLGDALDDAAEAMPWDR